MRGGRMEDSAVRWPFAELYGIDFCCVGNVEVVEGCSVGVDAITMDVIGFYRLDKMGWRGTAEAE
jgi:hypothetical protein